MRPCNKKCKIQLSDCLRTLWEFLVGLNLCQTVSSQHLCEWIFVSSFLLFSHRIEMRSGTHLLWPDVVFPGEKSSSSPRTCAASVIAPRTDGPCLTSRWKKNLVWYISMCLLMWFDVRGRILVSTRPMCYMSIHSDVYRVHWMRHISSPTCHNMIKVGPLLYSPHQGVIPPYMPEYQYP